jgi:hypothetical protein
MYSTPYTIITIVLVVLLLYLSVLKFESFDCAILIQLNLTQSLVHLNATSFLLLLEHIASHDTALFRMIASKAGDLLTMILHYVGQTTIYCTATTTTVLFILITTIALTQYHKAFTAMCHALLDNVLRHLYMCTSTNSTSN